MIVTYTCLTDAESEEAHAQFRELDSRGDPYALDKLIERWVRKRLDAYLDRIDELEQQLEEARQCAEDQRDYARPDQTSLPAHRVRERLPWEEGYGRV